MDKPGFIVPPPWLLPDGDEESTVPAEVLPPAAFPAFRPAPHAMATPREKPVARGWRLTLDDGQSILVEGAIVLGRDPAEVSAHPHATRVPVQDPARSVSKTHALLDLDGTTLSAIDLGSTNGVSILAPDGGVIDLEPGARGILESGSRLILGDFGATVTLE